MLSIVGLFLIFQVCYHIIVTFFGYGISIISQSNLALIRDIFRIIICGIGFILNIKYRKNYIKARRKILITFLLLILLTSFISYFIFQKGISDLLIGIKYGLRWIFILLSAASIGYFYKDNIKKHENKISKYLKRGLFSILIFGRIFQILKIVLPNFFFSLGYGKLDDFHYGENPPIYYLTGYEGTLRRQGLFAGPNNYGYFLVLFLPLIINLFPFKEFKKIKSRGKTDRFNFLFITCRIISIIASISRTAIIGCSIVLLLINIPYLKTHKKTSFIIGIFIILSLIGLSLFKRESTTEHIQAKRNGIQYVIDKPLGYGLGSSGPAIHHSGEFLPENYYIQLMLDTGTIGFLIRCGLIILGLIKEKKLCLNLLKNGERNNNFYHWFLALQKGLFALLIMGIFLHVFEDSMVNYIFFIIYGGILGYLSALNTNKNQGINDLKTLINS